MTASSQQQDHFRHGDQRYPGCDLPIGAYAWLDGSVLYLRGMHAASDGQQVTYLDATGSPEDPAALGRRLAADMLQQTAGLA